MRTAQSSAPLDSGRSSHGRPASSRPLACLSRRTPSGSQVPHRLKRNATPAARHRSRTDQTHSSRMGRASGPDSPDAQDGTITVGTNPIRLARRANLRSSKEAMPSQSR